VVEEVGVRLMNLEEVEAAEKMVHCEGEGEVVEQNLVHLEEEAAEEEESIALRKIQAEEAGRKEAYRILPAKKEVEEGEEV
jgi:hypothetical protein